MAAIKQWRNGYHGSCWRAWRDDVEYGVYRRPDIKRRRGGQILTIIKYVVKAVKQY